MRNLIIIGVILVSLYSCEKQPFDYRNKFVGDYEFTKRAVFFYPPNNNIDTTYTTVFKGSVKNGKESNEMEIHYENYTNSLGEIEKRKVLVFIDYDGVFTNSNNIYGKFISANKVELIFPTSGNGGVGQIIYLGLKK